MALYFLHIPKTAGTSFTKFIDRAFHPSSILKPQTWNQFYDQRPIKLEQTRLIRGHFGRGAYHLNIEPLLTVTLLRDPVERTLSQYNHIRIDRKYNNWTPEPIELPSLAEALDHPFWRPFFSNTQARYLGLDLNPLPHLAPGFLWDSWEPFLHPEIDNSTLFYRALEHLQSCVCVGVQERLPEFLSKVSNRFGLPCAVPEKAMVLPGRIQTASVSPALIRKIQEMNSVDIELHNEASKLAELNFTEPVGCAACTA